MIVRYLPGVYFTNIGVKEAYLGFLNFLALPWTFKFLWAPGVDLFGTKRGWLVKIELIITLATFAVAFLIAMGPSPLQKGVLLNLNHDHYLAVMGVLGIVVFLAFVSATHDISIDGYYMEAITDPTEQAKYTGVRVMTYRLAIIFAKSVLVAVASFFTWSHSFALAGICMGFFFLFHSKYLPVVEGKDLPIKHRFKDTLRKYVRAFFTYLDQPKVGIVLLFIITYKLGDEVLFSMHTPFLMRELRLTMEQLSWIAGIIGTIASILGSLISAHVIKSFGFKRAVWPLTLGMNLNIWAYVWLAWKAPDPSLTSGLVIITIVCAYEQFAAGLGNAVLVVYLMRTCKPEFKASHYAMATAIASIGGTIFGGFGGVIVEAFGYVNLFILAFFAAIPSMIALIFLPMHEEHKLSQTKSA